MHRWHAHPQPQVNDMVSWRPEDAPAFTGRELLRALPAGCLGFVAIGVIVALAFLFLGVSPVAHPGWW